MQENNNKLFHKTLVVAWILYNDCMDKKLANAKTNRILWVDLEMTGLDANTDLILEIAAIVTDWDFNEIATYEGVVKHDNTQLLSLLAKNKFWETQTASRDGLVAQNDNGKPLDEIENEVLSFIDKNFEADKPVLLAGNSIHMDRRFITAQWPRFDARLHYRMLDVTAWKVVFEGKFGKKFAKPEEHRALGDIRGSIMELQYYLGKLK
jgi:oligoribonuclease